MAARVDDFNKKFLYTDTNPENIIAAKEGAFFFRNNKEFFVNYEGNLQVGPWIKLPYKTVILPPPPASKIIQYKKPYEIWFKTTNGLLDDFGNLKPKTGWKFYSYEDAFSKLVFRKITWHFPVPKSTNDPAGVDGNRSYDSDFFYAKVYGKWYRTPLTLWNFVDGPLPEEDPDLTALLPFVDLPRAGLGISPEDTGCSQKGDQTYDNSYFYVKVSDRYWKRSRLNIYDTIYKMASF